MAKARWLVKSDPCGYSFGDLLRDGRTRWDGVANALALRHMRAMAPGDEVFVYETGAVRAVVGMATVAAAPVPDPRGKVAGAVAVDLAAGVALLRPVTLAEMRGDRSLATFPLVRMPRLSVMPVRASEWKAILARSRREHTGV
jgi:predicted RNA-binding protein with PUA-like domain